MGIIGSKKNLRSRRLKIFLWLALILILGLMTIIFIRYRISTQRIEQPTPPESSRATLSINNFEHTAVKDGKKQWALTAESAELYSKTNTATLKKMNVTFYREDRQPVTLSADKGQLDIDTEDMTVSGNVDARNPGYRLETEHLKYKRASHIIIIDAPVEITGDINRFQADSARYDINSGDLTLEGNVEGWISGTFDL